MGSFSNIHIYSFLKSWNIRFNLIQSWKAHFCWGIWFSPNKAVDASDCFNRRISFRKLTHSWMARMRRQREGSKICKDWLFVKTKNNEKELKYFLSILGVNEALSAVHRNDSAPMTAPYKSHEVILDHLQVAYYQYLTVLTYSVCRWIILLNPEEKMRGPQQEWVFELKFSFFMQQKSVLIRYTHHYHHYHHSNHFEHLFPVVSMSFLFKRYSH